MKHYLVLNKLSNHKGRTYGSQCSVCGNFVELHVWRDSFFPEREYCARCTAELVSYAPEKYMVASPRHGNMDIEMLYWYGYFLLERALDPHEEWKTPIPSVPSGAEIIKAIQA